MVDKKSKSGQGIAGNPVGFTLVEVLIAIAISAVVFTAVISIYSHMQHSSAQQIAMTTLQQNQRGALDILEHDLRLIGMDRNQTRNFKITDVCKYSIAGPPPVAAVLDATPSGSPVLSLQVDLNSDGNIDNDETITYLLYDRYGDGQAPWELGRSTPLDPANPDPQMIAEGVDAIGFAYAFDANDDGDIDRALPAVPGGPSPIIWAVDTNNDGKLDTDLSGALLPQNVLPDKIRSVQFWLLGRTLRSDPKYFDNRQYSLGDRLVPPGGPFNDHYRRWLLTEIIHCRNL